MLQRETWLVCVMFGILVASMAFVGANSIPTETKTGSLPIHQTAFADYVNDSARVFQFQDLVIDNGSFIVVDPGSEYYSINESQARENAISFFQLNYPEWDWSSFHLIYASRVSHIPAWRFFVLEKSIWVQVSAASGEVIMFECTSGALRGVRENQTEPITLPAAEASAMAFLSLNNITLPADAHYCGAIQYHPSDNYRIAFEHISNGIPIKSPPSFSLGCSGDGIVVEVDALTGRVCGFYYVWRNLGVVTLSRTISKFSAYDIAEQVTGKRVVMCNLTVSDTVDTDNVSHHMRLVWYVVTSGNVSRCDMLIDARTGEVVQTIPYRESLDLAILERPSEMLWILFTVTSIAVAGAVALSTEYALRRSNCLVEA